MQRLLRLRCAAWAGSRPHNVGSRSQTHNLGNIKIIPMSSGWFATDSIPSFGISPRGRTRSAAYHALAQGALDENHFGYTAHDLSCMLKGLGQLVDLSLEYQIATSSLSAD